MAATTTAMTSTGLVIVIMGEANLFDAWSKTVRIWFVDNVPKAGDMLIVDEKGYLSKRFPPVQPTIFFYPPTYYFVTYTAYEQPDYHRMRMTEKSGILVSEFSSYKHAPGVTGFEPATVFEYSSMGYNMSINFRNKTAINEFVRKRNEERNAYYESEATQLSGESPPSSPSVSQGEEEEEWQFHQPDYPPTPPSTPPPTPPSEYWDIVHGTPELPSTPIPAHEQEYQPSTPATSFPQPSTSSTSSSSSSTSTPQQGGGVEYSVGPSVVVVVMTTPSGMFERYHDHIQDWFESHSDHLPVDVIPLSSFNRLTVRDNQIVLFMYLPSYLTEGRHRDEDIESLTAGTRFKYAVVIPVRMKQRGAQPKLRDVPKVKVGSSKVLYLLFSYSSDSIYADQPEFGELIEQFIETSKKKVMPKRQRIRFQLQP
jgi:hypothetical protein